MYSTVQAAVQHVVLRPLRGGHRDPPPGTVQQPATPPLQKLEEHGGKEWVLLARGDANHAAQPRHRVGQEGNQVNHKENRNYQQDVRQRRHNRPSGEQRMVYVETLRNADSPFSGDETDNQQETATKDQAQHVDEEPQTLSNGSEEENEVSKTEMKNTQPASKEHSVKSNTKDDKTSGHTKRNKVNMLAEEFFSPHFLNPV